MQELDWRISTDDLTLRRKYESKTSIFLMRFHVDFDLIGQTHTMPRRTPLVQISDNRRKGAELTPYLRGKSKARKDTGQTQDKISTEMHRPLGTVKMTLRLGPVRRNGNHDHGPVQQERSLYEIAEQFFMW